ncbi:hypothetical protein LCGC14_1089160 [marine sediment metagenome]|uniref:DNA methyltransferase n=1 Tax=marine sediment metagenome TaxID=412755 RepID=A0A0F9N0P6_9ZZZZ
MSNTKKFSVIYADPPWKYSDKQSAGNRGAEFKYPCMTIAELIHFRVDGRCVYDLAAENSVCFLWTTGPMMPEALKLLASWGHR